MFPHLEGAPETPMQQYITIQCLVLIVWLYVYKWCVVYPAIPENISEKNVIFIIVLTIL